MACGLAKIVIENVLFRFSNVKNVLSNVYLPRRSVTTTEGDGKIINHSKSILKTHNECIRMNAIIDRLVKYCMDLNIS